MKKKLTALLLALALALSAAACGAKEEPDTAPAGTPVEQEKPAEEEKPAEPAKPVEEEKPAEPEKPAEEKPAEEKPAEEKPAEEESSGGWTGEEAFPLYFPVPDGFIQTEADTFKPVDGQTLAYINLVAGDTEENFGAQPLAEELKSSFEEKGYGVKVVAATDDDTHGYPRCNVVLELTAAEGICLYQAICMVDIKGMTYGVSYVTLDGEGLTDVFIEAAAQVKAI